MAIRPAILQGVLSPAAQAQKDQATLQQAQQLAGQTRGPLSAADQASALWGGLTGSTGRTIYGPDPVADVQALIPNVMEVPGHINTNDPIPLPRSLQEGRKNLEVVDEYDLARIQPGYRPLGPVSQRVPVLDEQGMPTGQTEPLSDLYSRQLEREATARGATQDAILDLVEGADERQGLRRLLEVQDAARLDPERNSPFAVNKWQQLIGSADASSAQAKKERERVISDSKDTVLDVASLAREALFSPVEAALTTKTEDGSLLPTGMAALYTRDGGLFEEQMNDLNVISLGFGLAAMGAATQTGVLTESRKNEEGYVELDTEFGSGDTMHISDAANAIKARAIDYFKNAGYDPKGLDLDAPAHAMVKALIKRGSAVEVHDPKKGRSVVMLEPNFLQKARSIDRIVETLTGRPSRPAMGESPMPQGRGLLDWKRGVTRNSLFEKVPGGGIVTRAADWTKSLLGAVAVSHSTWNIKLKQLEVELVMAPDMLEVDPTDRQTVIYSRHPLANRLGFSEANYRAARNQVNLPDEGSTTTEAERKEAIDTQARDVMSLKKREIELYLEAASNIAGKGRFNRFIHAINNQRFYTNTFDGDYMGSKNVLRETLGFAKKDYAHSAAFFDEEQIARLNRLAKEIWSGNPADSSWGSTVEARLRKADPADLATIGAMINAVVYYYSALEPDQNKDNIARLAPAKILEYYKPHMGETLARKGAWLDRYMNPEQREAASKEPSAEENMKLWAATEKGSIQGTLNLWRDFNNARLASASKQPTTQLTHHSISDGNQSGVFLQLILYGTHPDRPMGSLSSLAISTRGVQDFRELVYSNMVHKLETVLQRDEGDRQDSAAYLEFFRRVEDKLGARDAAKLFMKKPIMQAVYGKNVHMFRNELLEALDDLELQDIYEETLGHAGLDLVRADALPPLEIAVAEALSEIIDSRHNSIMQDMGQAFAIVGVPATATGPDGDTLVMAPVSLGGIHAKRIPNRPLVPAVDPISGQKVMLANPVYETIGLHDPDSGLPLDLPRTARQYQPGAAKSRWISDHKEMRRRRQTDPLGYGLRRAMPVLMVQALDGALIKLTTILANRDIGENATARNVMWVHDSAISSPGQGLIYNHIYNNVALSALAHGVKGVPDGVAGLKPAAKGVMESLRDNLYSAINATKQRMMDYPDGTWISIGSEGELPALGGVLHEHYNWLHDTERHKNWTKAESLEKEKARVTNLLLEAKKLGWVPPVSESEAFQNELIRAQAVPAINIPGLMDIGLELIQLRQGVPGADRLTPWMRVWKGHVDNTARQLQKWRAMVGLSGKPTGQGLTHLSAQEGGAASRAPSLRDPKLTLADIARQREEAAAKAKEERELYSATSEFLEAQQQSLKRASASAEKVRRHEDFFNDSTDVHLKKLIANQVLQLARVDRLISAAEEVSTMEEILRLIYEDRVVGEKTWDKVTSEEIYEKWKEKRNVATAMQLTPRTSEDDNIPF